MPAGEKGGSALVLARWTALSPSGLVLGHPSGSDEALEHLRAEGYRMDISCCWRPSEGHGGPTLSPPIMGRLGDLGIEIRFDFY